MVSIMRHIWRVIRRFKVIAERSILACAPSYLGQNFKLTHGPGPRARPVGGDPEYFSRFPRDSIAESGVRTTG